jgi:ankyrin repeat protein
VLRQELQTPLRSSEVHQAILRGSTPSLVSTAIKSNLNILDRLDDLGYTPLHWAARRGRSDIARALLEAGAKPDSLSSTRTTALEAAVICKNIEVVKVLLTFGSDVNHLDPDTGTTAIYFAFDQPQMLRLLVDNGAKV